MITQKRIHILLFMLLAFAVINSINVSAITGSIGNARMILYPEISEGKTTTIEKTILVKNINDVSINIKLETDENSSKFLKIVDDNFSLNPGEERKANFRVEVNKEGRYEGKINVFFTPGEGKDPGVVLSSTVIIIAIGDGSDTTEASDETDSITEKAVDSNENKTITPILLIMGFSSIILIIILIFLAKSLKKPAVRKRGDFSHHSNMKIKNFHPYRTGNPESQENLKVNIKEDKKKKTKKINGGKKENEE